MSTLDHLLQMRLDKPLTAEMADEIKSRFMREASDEVINLAREFQRLAGHGHSGQFIPAPAYIAQAMACRDYTRACEIVKAIEDLA